ncbi:MAG: acetyl-CoA C-acetyltransferase [Deltaproteobacteria bacterium]|nr:acetyl-CoA C-acetyltransferase [Deltaproteobacteria bacterium]
MKEAVIVSAVRTPIGSFHGSLSSLTAPALGSIVIAEALRGVSLGGDGVNEVVMGNVLSAGLGQAPARQAALGAGLAKTVGCTTINKVCGSGLKAVMLAAQAIQLGQAEVVVAGGMESMSNAPYLLDKARGGYRMGNGTLVDSLIKDGLWDVYNDFHMGAAAELCAEKFKITREEQDEFAILSYQRAQAAQRLGLFKKEIAQVKISRKQNQSTVVEEDEEVQKFDGEKMRRLQPAFRAGGTVTAGNASSVSDGAAALVLMARERAQRLGIQPLVRVVGYAASAREPEWFSIAPIEAISSLLQSTGCRLADVDLAEINEAFAVSSIAVHREVGLDPEKVNVRGGAIALGHPIGASGARILTTLIHALADLGKKRGIAALCIGGGEGVAMLVERV